LVHGGKQERELKREFIFSVWCGGFEGKIKKQIMMEDEDLLFFY